MTLTVENEETKGKCIANTLRITEYARRFMQGHWSFLGVNTSRHSQNFQNNRNCNSGFSKNVCKGQFFITLMKQDLTI